MAALLDTLDDGADAPLVILAFSRAPFATHGSVRVVCRRLNAIIASPAFHDWRVERGLAEHGLVAAGGARDFEITDACSIFFSGQWRQAAALSVARRSACSAIMEDEDGQPEMWVMGGVGGAVSEVATVEAYNPRTNTWRVCLPLSQRRQSAVAGVVGGLLVVAGGLGHDGVLTSVEAYTPTGWTPLPPLPYAVYEATACVVGGRLYVMGGRECAWLQVLEMTEENQFSWSVKAGLPAPRGLAASAAVVAGKLWLMGGSPTYTAGDSVFVYDIARDSWAAGPALPRPLALCRATVHDRQIYLFGHDGILRHGNAGWVAAEAGPVDSSGSFESILLG
jgi:hypothetical protein